MPGGPAAGAGARGAGHRSDLQSGGLSNHELEKLAQLATTDAMDVLRQALSAHEQRVAEAKLQRKTGRNALVGGVKKRIGYLRELIDEGERRNAQRQERQGS